MNPITASVWIDASPEEVFAIATNFDECADWLSEVTETRLLTPGPVGVGTKFSETRRADGRESKEEFTVAAFDPPRTCTLHCEANGAIFSTVMMFEADREGTIASMDTQVRPTSALAKLMSPMMSIGARKVRKSLVQDLHDLKAAAEKARAVAAGA
jgi:uncharacterized protein YndB with AHSA1/START domain